MCLCFSELPDLLAELAPAGNPSNSIGQRQDPNLA